MPDNDNNNNKKCCLDNLRYTRISSFHRPTAIHCQGSRISSKLRACRGETLSRYLFAILGLRAKFEGIYGYTHNIPQPYIILQMLNDVVWQYSTKKYPLKKTHILP